VTPDGGAVIGVGRDGRAGRWVGAGVTRNPIEVAR